MIQMEESAKKVLIDTNVFIALEESGRVMDDIHADMLRLCRELHFDLYCHPAQVLDLERDSHDERKEIQVSRLRSYPKLEAPPEPSPFDLMNLGWKESCVNDRIDNLLLFALNRNAISYLITEDRGMHKKARRSGLGSRVFTAEDFLSYLFNEKNQKREIDTNCVKIKTVNLYSVPIEQEFFDSLRDGYGGAAFDKWYGDKAAAGRKAWIVGDEKKLDALCMYKAEDENEKVTDAGERLPGRVLKLCTFKVARIGFKLGERLLFVAFTYAIDNRFDFVYIQVNEYKQQDLVALLEDFGFVKLGPYKKDYTYVKDMRKGTIRAEWNEEQRLEYDIRHYPHFIDGIEVKKFLVPIQPTFHDRLFPDLEKRGYLPGLIPDDTSEANAIKKAYLCGSGIKYLGKGDVLLFYRSSDRKSIACVGVVEDFLRSDNASEIIPFVARRTVFFDDEIRNKARGGELLAILFRVVRYLKNEVKLSQLKKAGMMGQIQSIREIGDEMYRMVFVPQLKET